MIRGKRGRIGKGYKLDDSNSSGTYYVRVWDRRTYEQVTRQVDGETIKRSRCKWKHLGRYDDPATLDKLQHHLSDIYGSQVKSQDVRDELARQHDEMEEKRIIKLKQLHDEIEVLSAWLDLEKIPRPKTVAASKRLIKRLKG